MTEATPPGWYPATDQPGYERYWDGHQWAPTIRAIPGPPPVSGERHAPRLALIAAAVLACAIVGGVFIAKGHAKAAAFVSRGSMTLSDSDHNGIRFSGTSCEGSGGFSDIHTGAQVTVTDQSGKTVGISELQQGSYAAGNNCAFPFQVKVPSGLKFYGVAVTHRGTVQYSETQMRSGPALSLGD